MDNLWMNCASNCGICKSTDQCDSYQQVIHRLSTGYPQAEQLELESGHDQLQLQLPGVVLVNQSKTKKEQNHAGNLKTSRKTDWHTRKRKNNDANYHQK